MKLWIDDVRPAPEGYVWCKSVEDAKIEIILAELDAYLEGGSEIRLISIDHDAGDYATDGGDFINVLNWLEETGRNYPIHIHTANPVGRQNMRAIIEHNGWREIL